MKEMDRRDKRVMTFVRNGRILLTKEYHHVNHLFRLSPSLPASFAAEVPDKKVKPGNFTLDGFGLTAGFGLVDTEEEGTGAGGALEAADPVSEFD
jgi:hypothetical protein